MRLDVLLRQHILAARRTILGGAADIDYEIQPCASGSWTSSDLPR